MPALAVVGSANGSHCVAVAMVEAVTDLTRASAVCSPRDDDRSATGFTKIWVDQDAG